MKRNWLRGIAIALIIMPEPFTTPIGAILLLVSFFLPKRHKDRLSDMEALVRRYAQYRQITGIDRLTLATRSIVHHTLNRNTYINSHETPWHDDIDRKTRAAFHHQYLTDSRRMNDRMDDYTVYHVMQKSVPQYTVSPAKTGQVIHHALNTSRQLPQPGVYYSSLRPILPVHHPTVIHHSLKRA